MSRSTFVQVTNFKLPLTAIPLRSFIHDLRADLPRYFLLQSLPPKSDMALILQRLELDSSFISLYSIALESKPEVTIGYCFDILRGNVRNLGMALLIASARTLSASTVDLSVTQTLNLGEFLKIFKLGNSAIYIGASNPDAISFFY